LEKYVIVKNQNFKKRGYNKIHSKDSGI
jgi:hypothetical protein